jgi:D-3-phosphoglycerate dehydrogenase
MPRPTLVVPDDDPVYYGGPDHPDLRRLAEHGELRHFGTRAADRAELFRRLAEAEAIINVRGHTKLDAEALGHAPRLKLISVVGTGVDNIDLAAARERGVLVSNTPGVGAASVVEIGLALLLAVARHVPVTDRLLRQGVWDQRRGPELEGKTVGLLGLGDLGRRFARICQGLGMRTIGWSLRYDPERAAACGVELVEKDDLLRESDVVSLHIRATPETRGFIGQRELALMKPTAILINTARGAVIDNQALLEALQSKQIFGAGLDVHVPEPLPLELNVFTGCENVVMTPHLGGSTWEAVARTQRMPVDNIIAWLEGHPQHVVNP